jgi:hypothetical protein
MSPVKPGELAPGDVVDIAIRGVTVQTIRDGDEVIEIRIEHTDAGTQVFTLPAGAPYAPHITIERQAPAEWPPMVGDVWLDRDGDEWLAFRRAERYDGTRITEGPRLEMVRAVEQAIGHGNPRPDRFLANHGPVTLARAGRARERAGQVTDDDDA